MRPSRTARTARRPGSSAARSRDRGHHPPSTQPVVGPFGFNRNRNGGFLTGPASDGGFAVGGADAMSLLRPPALPPGLGLSQRTTRAWPPTYEVLSTRP